MDSNIVREIAAQIVDEQLLQNWKFYALIIGISMVGAAIGAFASSYLKERGKNLATKSDLTSIVNQLTAMTTATEGVKSEIAQLEWKKKEISTLQRRKLEELLSLVYQLHHWLDVEHNSALFEGEPNKLPSPISKIEVLGALYFPEIKQELTQLSVASLAYRAWIWQGKKEISDKKTQGEEFARPSQEYINSYQEVYASLLDQTSALQTKAIALMGNIINS